MQPSTTPQTPSLTAQPAGGQPQASPPAPLFQIDCMCLPPGKMLIFNLVKARAVVYPGWLMVYRQSDGKELRRYQLAPDIKMSVFFGFVRFKRLNGYSYGYFDFQNNFYFGTWTPYILLVFVALLNLYTIVVRQSGAVDRVFLLTLSFLALILDIAVIVLFRKGSPRGKQLITACQQAAGVVTPSR